MSETKFTFVWHIENYFLCSLGNKKFIRSPGFVDCVFGCQWRLRVYPRGDSVSTLEFCTVCVERCSNIKEDMTMDFKLEITKEDDDIVKSVDSGTVAFDKNIKGLCFTTFIERRVLVKEFAGNNTLTVLCHIMTDEPRTEHWETECTARTKIGVDKFSLRLNIDVDHYPHDWSDAKEFQFSASSTLEISWAFIEDKLYFRVLKIKDDDKPRFMLCKITLLDKQDHEFCSSNTRFLFRPQTSRWHLRSFVSTRLLREQRHSLLHSDKFYAVNCDFTISNDSYSNAIERYGPSNTNAGETDSLPRLQSDDIHLQVGTKLIPVRKSILAKGSQVFSAKFKLDKEGNQSGIFKIDDVDSETLEDLVEFLRTGKIDMQNKNAMKLLIAANRYLVSALVEKCYEFLISSLSLDNVCETVATAHLVGCMDLKEAAIHYIKTHVCKLLVSEKWFDLARSNVTLAGEIIRQLLVCECKTTSISE